ncbi:ORF-75 peptide [Chrysodeixis chalcites nucleopolyhedrovirus]|uniref:ORF-75 peptide n=1 Tax=Chrysodeixis chalcites nucleopolyhedrovirus TaxID=320432 RepID=Q4KT05_9ABAC|nr:ORF-75 peptide [Chrysodeixis chalcites nucleopolyhedrovirus]AAY84006.1 ORF-75 peptide [Chrysodeixis chalcites nucleopolyhedrovirus]AGE61635.1 hypothetical protein [Chrysodeixis chalcites nucleopolyhedrovirus]AGE61784.1 hypothetical protein [Chrysodeixis chalcites nucleopolyhedrovirus]
MQSNLFILSAIVDRVDSIHAMEPFRDMHIDVDICGRKSSLRARVYNTNNIEVRLEDIPEALRTEYRFYTGDRSRHIRVVYDYTRIECAKPTVKSLSDSCFKVLMINFKRPFRKIKSLNTACMLRDHIIDAGLTLNLQKNYGAILLEYKLPLRYVTHDDNRIRLDRCVSGHVLTKEQLISNYYIDYFCKNCLSDCFIYQKK